MAKIFPWTRAIVLILSMLLTQTPLASAGAAPPGDVTSAPERRAYENECKIKVLATAVEDYPDQIDPESEPSGTTNKKPFGADVVENAGDRKEIHIWVVVMNWTGEGACTPDPTEPVMLNRVEIYVGDSNWTVHINEVLQSQHDYWDWRYTYQIDALAPNPIEIGVDAFGSLPNQANAPVHDEDKVWKVHLTSPGFEVVSFTPSKTEADPGEFVDFTLRVKNTRPGVTIDSLSFAEDDSEAAGKCDDISQWTLYPGGGSLNGELLPNQEALCVFANIPMPPSTETGEYRLTGSVVAGAGADNDATVVAESDPVALYQASIEVTKAVDRIIRGGQEVEPPARPGDVIHYAITVKNTSVGNIELDQLTIQDSLTGRVSVPAGLTLGPGESTEPFSAQWTVRPNSQDPLTNIVSASARVIGPGGSVSDDAAVSVDIADQALRVALVAEPAARDVGEEVTFHLTLYNDGDQFIVNPAYAPLPGGLQTVGLPPDLPPSLAPGSQTTVFWKYVVQDTDPDPLINTVRVSGSSDGATLFAQAQAVVDVTNPDIGITVTVTEPKTTTVLRGGEAVYAIEVENKGQAAMCGVTVAQYRVDPDTGNEALVIPALPLSGLNAGGGLDGQGTANTSSTYLVTASEKDPLHMVFEVNATLCENGAAFTDRTSRVLEISDVQVNAVIRAEVNGVPSTSVEVGEPLLQFEYLVTNVGTIPLSNVSAVYCFPSHEDCTDPTNLHSLNLAPLDNGALLNFETATDSFAGPTPTDADANAGQLPVEVTLSATDNRGRDVTLKTTGAIDVTSPDFKLEVTGPTQAVIGDAREYTFTLTNSTGVALTDVNVYVVEGENQTHLAGPFDIPGAPGGSETHAEPFPFTIAAPPGTPMYRLTLRAEGTRSDTSGNLVATGTHDIELIPLITVDKFGPASATPGQDIAYTVTITNNSIQQTFTATDVLDDVLEARGVSVSLDNFTGWTGPVGVLGPEATATATLTLENVQADVTPLVNTFTVMGTKDGQPVPPASDQHTVNVACPVGFWFDVTETTIDDPLDPFVHILHETLVWEITLYNTTSVDLTNVYVKESLNEWGSEFVPVVWPGADNVIPANGSVTLPVFQQEITKDFYSEIIEDVYMTSTVQVTFDPVASRGDCVGEYEAPLYSPIVVEKLADPSVALTGDPVTYTLRLHNLAGPSDPHNTYTVTLTDPLLSSGPIPMRYNGPTQAPTESGVMGPGETVEGPTLTYIVQQGDPEKLINTATAEFPDPADPDATFYTNGQAEVLTIAPLTLVKTPSARTGVRGTEITYTYELTNNTEYDIIDISLVDVVSGETIPLLFPGPYSVEFGEATLAPFETKTIADIPYLIPIDSPNPVINTATATGVLVGLPGGARDVSAEATIAVQLEEPEITIEKRIVDAGSGEDLPDVLPITAPNGDGIVEGTVGQQVQYCFTVTNGDQSQDAFVSDIVIEDAKLGAGVLQPLFLAAVHALPTHQDRPRDNVLYGGESVDFCYPQAGSLALNREQGDPQTNTVTLRGTAPVGEGTLPIYTEDSVTVDILGTDILITKSTSQPLAYIGQDVTYEILIENKNTTFDIENIMVTDSFLGEIDPADENWNWPGAPGTLHAGEVATYSYVYTIRPQDPDPLVNTATVTGTLTDPADPHEVEDATQAALAITPSQLLVRKYPSQTRALPEQAIRYTIAITNVGQVPVYNLTATDPEMPGLPAPDLTELWPNKTAYITYTLPMRTEAQLAANPDLDPFVNTVKAQGTIYDAQGVALPEPVTGQATALVDIIQPNVSISKVATEQAAQPGGEVEYTITIRNTSQGDTLTDLIFRDLTTGGEIDLDSECPGSECVFTYGPEPYTDPDGDGTFDPNPLDGEQYDPGRGLEPGELLIGTIRVTVPADVPGTEFTNTAEIEASAGAATVRDRNAETIDVRLEGINVTKSAKEPGAVVGQIVEYTVSVENTGRVPFTRLEITDKAVSDAPVKIEGGFPISDEGGAETLDPGEVYNYIYEYTVQETDGDSYTNVATVKAFTAGNASISSFGQETIAIRVAEVGVEKVVCAEDHPVPSGGSGAPTPCTPVVNVADLQPDDVYYYIQIVNSGVVRLENIQVNDPLAPDGTFDAANWPGGQNALEPNGEAWFKYAYTVEDDDLDPLQNTVVVTGESATTPPQTAEDAATAALRLVTSDLQLTKTANVETARVGDTVEYSLSVTHLNPSGEAITNITITDPLNGASALCTIASLAPGATSDPCTFDHIVSQADPVPLVNQAFAEGNQGGVIVRDTAAHTLEVITPGLSVTKTPSVPVAEFGDVVTFTYRVKNTGTRTITELAVTDSDPAITFNQDWPETLAVGQTVVRTATRTMSALDPDPYTNTVTVTGNQGGLPVRGEASATVALAAQEAVLAVTNVPDRQYAVDGQTVIFAYTARNLGTEPLTSLAYHDNLCGEGRIATELAPRGSITIYCEATAQLPGPLVSTVRITATHGATTVSDTATAQVEVLSGGLLVTKTADRFVAEPGDTITFTITVENVGDELLANLELFESTSLALTPDLPDLLQPGASATLKGAYTVPTENPPDSVANTVTVTALGVNTENTYQDSASAAVAVQTDPNATLALTKQASVKTQDGVLRARPGDTVTYIFTVRNVSDATAPDVGVSDPAIGLDTTLGDLAPGETATLTGMAMIPADHAATAFANTASVSTDSSTAPVEQDTASATVPVQLAELTKTANVDDDVEPGEEVEYSFHVQSLTSAPLSGITIEDDGLTLDEPITEPIAGNGALDRTGVMTIPPDYAEPEFVNTATLRMNGEWLDDASATVTVVKPVLEITINSISQMDPDTGQTVSGPFQTGEMVKIDFTVVNTGEEPIAIVSVSRQLEFPVGGPVPVICQSRGALDPGIPWDGDCFYTPPTGLDPGDLNPLLTLTVNGGLPGDDPIQPDTAEATLPLVDLVLGAELDVSPNPAERGENVIFTLTLTNDGASPIGCDITVRDERPCWTVDFGALPQGWPALSEVFADELDRLQATVLQPGDVEEFISDPFEVPSTALHTELSVTVTGGSYDDRIDTDDLGAYKVQATATDTLAINYEGVVMAITAAEQTFDGQTLEGTENRPLQTGKPVTVRFTVVNDSETTLNDLEYGIVFGGQQFQCAPAQPGATDVLPIGGSRALSCQFTPPVADPSYWDADGLLRDIFVTLSAMDDAGQSIASSSAPADDNGDDAASTTNITEVHLIDLKLTMALQITKNGLPVTEWYPALPGDAVDIHVTFTNEGASPLGCPPNAPDLACALKLDDINIPLLGEMLGAYNTFLQNRVLQPGESYHDLPAMSWTVPPGTNETQIMVTASAGTYSQNIAANYGVYSTYASAMADLFIGLPKLSVSINAFPLPPVVGQNITYTVTVRNDGLIPVTLQSGTYQIIPLTTAQATDGIMLMSYGPRPQEQVLSGMLNFTPTALMPGQTATATVSKIEDQRGSYRFFATVIGFGLAQPVTVTSELTLTPFGAGTPTPTVDPATLDPNATEPQVTKEPTAPNVQPGGVIAWTVKVRNGSTGVMSGVVVTDSVPPTMTVTAAASDRGTATVNGQQVSLPVGTLNPGEVVTLTINTALLPAMSAPATVSNTACAARQGGPQVCDVGTVALGPGVSGLPATGFRSSGGALGWRWDALLGVAFSGALMLFLSMQVSRRRTLVAVIFLLVALAAIAGAVALVLTQDDGETQPDDQAQAPVSPAQGGVTDEIPADGAMDTTVPPEDMPLPTPYKPPKPSGARTLLIPKLGDQFPAPIPIMEVPIINRQWDVSGLGYYIGWLDGTTWLETDWGNTVLAAHVQLDAQTRGPFWGLSELVPGDEIIVREGDTERVYVVMSTRKVAPDDWTVTAPTGGPTLTLITCTDWNNAYGVFAQRLVVQAIPVA